MKGLRIGFIGGGRATRIILGGWEKAGLLPLLDITVSDSSDGPLETLRMQYPQIQTFKGGNRDAARGDIIILALHPPVAGDVLAAIRPVVQDDAIVVSLMPKIRIAQLSALLEGFSRIIRMIPNAPSIIGQGYNPVAFSAGIPLHERPPLVALFSALGECPEVPEDQLEAYAVLTAMGPTCLWFQMDELVRIGVGLGLSGQEAQTGIERMITGALRTMFRSGMKPAEVMDLVPVRPIGDEEAAIRAIYQDKLVGLYQKLRG
jgi:pyrroline-5-carboxylate reductase